MYMQYIQHIIWYINSKVVLHGILKIPPLLILLYAIILIYIYNS